MSDGNFKPKPGNRVQVNLDCDVFEAMQQNHGGWHPLLAMVSVSLTEICVLSHWFQYTVFDFCRLSAY